MKWLIIASLTLALLFGSVFLVINKQKSLSAVTEQTQAYLAMRDALKKDVVDLQKLRDERVALDKEWEEFKSREGELKGKYGDKIALAGECARLKERRDGLAVDIDDVGQRLVALREEYGKLVGATNELAKTIERLRAERSGVSDNIEKLERDRLVEEKRYGEMKKVADKESVRADSEKSRADAAKRDAYDAERRKEDAEIAAKSAEKKQEARLSALRVETDKEVAEQEKRASVARKAAGAATAKAEAEEAKLKTLVAEVAKLEARRGELAAVEKQLAETKAALAEEQSKLGQTRTKVSAQQIAAQIDGIREDVARRLDVFGSKLEELERKQNSESK